MEISPGTIAAAENLPRIGSDRRQVLATNRLLGLRVVEDNGWRIVFNGGPVGWKDVASATYEFNANSLYRVTVDFKRADSDRANNERFWQMRAVLAKSGGALDFDRIRNNGQAKNDILTTQRDETRWVDNGTETRIAATYGANRALSIVTARDPHSGRAEDLATFADNSVWAAAGNSQLVLATRATSERLLDDFGNQPALTEGAKYKGRPINIRLKGVQMPSALASDAQNAVEQRFARFAHADWDVNAVTDAADADVDLVITVEPVLGTDDYTMRLAAHFARGQRAGHLLYVATMMIR